MSQSTEMQQAPLVEPEQSSPGVGGANVDAGKTPRGILRPAMALLLVLAAAVLVLRQPAYDPLDAYDVELRGAVGGSGGRTVPLTVDPRIGVEVVLSPTVPDTREVDVQAFAQMGESWQLLEATLVRSVWGSLLVTPTLPAGDQKFRLLVVVSRDGLEVDPEQAAASKSGLGWQRFLFQLVSSTPT